MAQTGFTPILLYSSSTVSQAPAAGNLTNSTLGSELAINIADGKLFYKDSGGNVQVIGWKTVPTTAGGTGLTSYTAGDLIYYASGTAFTKLAIGASGRWLGSSGTAPQWNAPAALTETDDTNVTLTLGGSPSTALLNAVSMTLGWTGTLAVSRGGTGTGTAGITAFNNITGYTASGATGTTSTNLVFSTSPSLTTPTVTSASTNGQLNITGTGTGFVRAAVVYDVGASASTRGAGAFSVNAANNTNWFWGNPYGTGAGFTSTDQFIISRKAGSSLDTSTSEIANALFQLATDGRLKMPLTISVGGATPSTSGAGISFPATQSASTDPNTLDDYEEGTYTPTYQGFTLGNGTLNSAVYVKVGNIVYCAGRLTWGSTSAATSGELGVSVPIAVATSSSHGGGSGQMIDSGTGTYIVAAYFPPYTFNAIRFSDGTGIDAATATNPFTWTTNDSLTWSIVYSVG